MVTTRSGKKTGYTPTKYQVKKMVETLPMKSISLATAVNRIVRRNAETKVFFQQTSTGFADTSNSQTLAVYFDPFSGIQLGTNINQRVGDEIFVTKIVVSHAFSTTSDQFTDYKFKGRLVSASNFSTLTSSTYASYSGQDPCWVGSAAPYGTVQTWMNSIDGIENTEAMKFISSKGHTCRAAGLVPGSTVASWGFGAPLSSWKHTIPMNRKIRFEKGTSDEVKSSTSFIYTVHALGARENVDTAHLTYLYTSYAVFYKDM